MNGCLIGFHCCLRGRVVWGSFLLLLLCAFFLSRHISHAAGLFFVLTFPSLINYLIYIYI